MDDEANKQQLAAIWQDVLEKLDPAQRAKLVAADKGNLAFFLERACKTVLGHATGPAPSELKC